MGMRARAIEDLLEYRKPREDTSFDELGKRPPLAGGEMRALASALSGMSAGAGTYDGRMPTNQSFQTGLKMLGDYDRQREDQLLSNIKVAGLADEERERQARRAKPLDSMTRNLLQQRIATLPIPQTEMIEIPETMTFGDLEDNPILQSLSQDIPRIGKASVKDEIARAQEIRFQQKLKQPMSDVDRNIVNKYLERLGLSQQFPPGSTYGQVNDNEYLRHLLKDMKALQLSSTLSPRQEQQMRVTEQREARAQREQQRKIEREKKEDLRKEQEPIKKAKEELRESEEVSRYLVESIDKLSGMLETYGTSEITNPAIDAQMQALAGDIRLEMKELKNLGVLNGPDLQILQEQIPDLGGVSGFLSIPSRARAKLKQAKEQIERKMKIKRDLVQDMSSGGSGKTTQKFPRIIRKGNQQATVSNEQELKEAQAEGWQ